MISARTEVACVRVSYVSYVYSKRAALTRALVAFFTNERFVTVLCGPLVQQPQKGKKRKLEEQRLVHAMMKEQGDNM